jgi:hypothetical protein
VWHLRKLRTVPEGEVMHCSAPPSPSQATQQHHPCERRSRHTGKRPIRETLFRCPAIG